MKRIIALFLILSTAVCVLISCTEQTEKCEHKGSWVVATESTCTTAGLELLECSICGEQQTRTIPAKGHSWKDANCEEAKVCTECKLVDGEAKGHNYVSSVKKKATCTIDGIELHTCSLCSDSYEEKIDKKGHTNVLQKTGEDICKVCDEKTYSTYSIKALSALYSRLLVPKTATIHSVYAGEYVWEEKDCIAVVIHCTAQVVAGGFNDAEYVILFELESGKMTFDLAGEMKDRMEEYKSWSDNATGQTALDYLEKSMVYRDKWIDVLSLQSNKVLKLEEQDLDLIIQPSKDASGVFK